MQKLLDFDYSWGARWQPRKDGYYLVTTVYLRNKENETRENTTMTLQTFLANPNHIKGVHVDHINHNSLDYRRCNLRITNKNQNARNRKSKNKNNQSGYRNVAYIKSDKKHPYYVQLMVDGKNTVLGKFSDVHEAGRFAAEMREKYYGKYKGLS